jgi:hypothetical protein
VPIFDLYSKRKAALSKKSQDVYRYDVIPEPLRVQILDIWHRSIGNPHIDSFNDKVTGCYHEIVVILRRELGVLSLVKTNYKVHNPHHSYNELVEFFGSQKDVDKVLDVVELGCLTIDISVRQRGWINRQSADEVADSAIQEMNRRLKEHSVGYRYTDRQIIRIDGELTHQEIVKPALAVLRDPRYSAAQDEFLKAHSHYRSNEFGDALIECCKAFESTMKIICSKRGWKLDKNATSASLVKACLENGLVPAFWEGHINGLKNMLESSIPSPRNKLAGHGLGDSPKMPLSGDLVGYVINMTASTILFLTEAEARLK